jgi:hypothetical protein
MQTQCKPLREGGLSTLIRDGKRMWVVINPFSLTVSDVGHSRRVFSVPSLMINKTK